MFDGWDVVGGGGGTRFLESDDPHEGRAALLVTRSAQDTTSGTPSIRTAVRVPQDSQVRVSFWAASAASDAAGAVQVQVGAGSPATTGLPAGPFGWTRFVVDWKVPPKVVLAPVAVLAAGATQGTRIDDVAVQTQGSGGVEVTNGGFETSSAAVRITNSSLVLRGGDDIGLASRLAPEGAFDWSMHEYTGGSVLDGRGRFESGVAEIGTGRIPTGYYSLTLRVHVGRTPVRRSTDVVVTEGPPAGTPSPMLGVGVHLGGEPDDLLATKLRDLAALGLRTVRTDADWGSIEQQRGQYEFAGLDRIVAAMTAAGLRPLLIVDYRNALYDGGRTPSSSAGIAAYATFAAAIAARYRGADIEVYNEFDFRFNDGACGKSPTCYLALLGPTSTAIKSVGATGAVAGPAIAGLGVQQPWLQVFLDGGGLNDVDALSFHPYVQPDRPDALEPQLDTLRASMDAVGKSTTPVWFTEFGVTTTAGGLDERRQAEDAARVVGVAAAHGVARVYWYDAIDDGPDRRDAEDNFGLFRAPTSLAPAAFVPKPAAAVLATASRLTAGLTPAASTADGGPVRAVQFDGARRVTELWSPSVSGSAAVGRGQLVSMTGRALPASRTVQAGSAPVWVIGGPVG